MDNCISVKFIRNISLNNNMQLSQLLEFKFCINSIFQSVIKIFVAPKNFFNFCQSLDITGKINKKF